MKNILSVIIFLSAALTMTSCVMATGGDAPDVVESETATIHLSAPAKNLTRAGGDDEIEYFRIMMFKSSTGMLAYNEYYDMSSTTNPISLEVILGKYDFVFVANEHIDQTLHSRLEAMDGSASISDVEGLYFSSGSFSADKSIPGAGSVRDVTVAVDGKVIAEGVTHHDSWNISGHLYRLGIRVDLSLSATSIWYWNAMNNIRITRLPSKVFLLERRVSNGLIYNDSGYETGYRSMAKSDLDWTQTGNTFTGKKERIILPSSVFQSITDPDKAIMFQVDLEGVPLRSATLGVDEPADYTAPRNRHFKLNGTFDNDQIRFVVQVVDWVYFETIM